MNAQERAWLDDPSATPFPGPLAALRRFEQRAASPLLGIQLSTSERLLFVALVLRIDSRTGETSPRWNVSIAALARATGLSRSGAQRALNRLLEAGVVEIEERRRGGQQQTNRYRVIVPRPDDDEGDGNAE